MSEINYFDDSFKAQSSFIKWDVAGKSVAGTLVAKNQKPSSLNAGEMQWIYTVKQDDGSVILVGGKPIIDQQIENNGVVIGQKIALKYVGDKPSKRPGLNPTKIIQLYTPKDADGKYMMDTEWIANNTVKTSSEQPTGGFISDRASIGSSNDGEIQVDAIPFGPDTAVPATDDDTTVAIIRELAISKLGATAENFQQTVMNQTGLAFIKVNYEKIITALGNK
jgi:hypothetical protein